MIKIRISYDSQQELEKVLSVLYPVITGAKIKKSDTGQYKKIYITGRLRSE